MSRSDSLPISALQHWLYCPRQCALIHVERVWAENRLTAEGRLLHERPDKGRSSSRDGVRILRVVEITSDVEGLHGVADVVEMRGLDPIPVEYKRGRPKVHRVDEVQLCAQALCLEEMTGRNVPDGILFYGARRRRTQLAFVDALRSLTRTVANEARAAIETGALPLPTPLRQRCSQCSLKDLCRPDAPRALGLNWLETQRSRAGVPEDGP